VNCLGFRWVLRVILALLLLVLVVFAVFVIFYAFYDLPAVESELPQIGDDAVVVGLISDTHSHLPIYDNEARLMKAVGLLARANVSLIIHAGDVVDPGVIAKLEEIAPVIAVYGNTDPPEVIEAFPEIAFCEVGGYRIGVVHDVGLSWILGVTDRARAIAEGHGFDVLVIGHYHRPFIRKDGGRLYVCPGSPIDPIPPILTKPTIGLLIITEDGIMPVILEVK